MKHIETTIFITDDTGVLEAIVYGTFLQRGVVRHEGNHFSLMIDPSPTINRMELTPNRALNMFFEALGNCQNVNLKKCIITLLDEKTPIRVQLDIGYNFKHVKSMWDYIEGFKSFVLNP